MFSNKKSRKKQLKNNDNQYNSSRKLKKPRRLNLAEQVTLQVQTHPGKAGGMG